MGRMQQSLNLKKAVKADFFSQFLCFQSFVMFIPFTVLVNRAYYPSKSSFVKDFSGKSSKSLQALSCLIVVPYKALSLVFHPAEAWVRW